MMEIHPDPARKLSTNPYGIYHCCVYSEKFLLIAEELSETCRGSFQNKFNKLVHMVGFITRICHDARSHERKKNSCLSS
jgi:hypothetical protein